MAILKHMVALKVIGGFRGVIDFYYHEGIPCARTWPRSPGKKRSPEVMAQWPVFTAATQLWSELSDEVRIAYEDMAKVTNLTDKDMFFRGYISGILRFYVPPDALEG